MRKFRAVKCDSMNLMCGGIFFVIQAYRYISCFIFHNTDVYFLAFACDCHIVMMMVRFDTYLKKLPFLISDMHDGLRSQC